MLRLLAALCLAGALSACYGGQEKPDRILYPDGQIVPIGEQSYKPVPVKGPIATPEERAACAAVGGDIVQDGLAGYEMCRQYLRDAGKACSDSSDCLGRCDVPLNVSVDFDEPVTGQCTANDSPFGCYQSVTKGRAAPPICVD
jgi:hypothetical protein